MLHVPGSPLPAGELSRRGFMAGSAATLAVPAILGTGLHRVVSKNDPDVLKVGLIGCGGRGTGAASNALRAENGTVVLTAVADVFPEKIASSLEGLTNNLGQDAGRVQVDDDHKFSGFDAYQQLIASDVDVVLLATPPHFRPAHLAAAIGAGKHVFTEKPIAVDAPGVRSVLETAKLAKEKGLTLICGLCWRYNWRHRAFYEKIHEGSLGEIRAVYSTYNATPLGTNPRQGDWSEMEFQMRNWQHMLWIGGDHIVEQAVHSLDKQGWAMQDKPPLSCTAVGGRQAREGEERGNINDHFGVTYDYPDGVKAFHMCRQMSNCSNDNSDFVMGECGHGTVKGWSNIHTLEGRHPWSYSGQGNDMYQTEHDEMFASIRAGEARNDGEWVSSSTMLAIIARMAAYTGKTITWEEAMASEERLGPSQYSMDADYKILPVPVPGRTAFS
ncbi:MAG: Gfo/Idh/MocA family oxidoreductase [Planctomycetota bacterium]|nr:Gfo/Idh/MocA family oxidoreductase [Planctomycetota bacterium]